MAAAEDSVGIFSGAWSRLRAAASSWRRRGGSSGGLDDDDGGSEGDAAATVRSRLAGRAAAARRIGRKLAFLSFNLELLVFVYAFWRPRRRNLNWRQPIQALPMLLIPALATLIYAAFMRFTRTLDLKDKKMLERLREEKHENHCVTRDFDQNEQNCAKKSDLPNDGSSFSAAADSAETLKLGKHQQMSINLRNEGGGDISWGHSNGFQPMHSDGPISWSPEHLADDLQDSDHMQRTVEDHRKSGVDVANNDMAYSSPDSTSCFTSCRIVSSKAMDLDEHSPSLSSPKSHGGLVKEGAVQIACTKPKSNVLTFAELLHEEVEKESSKFYVPKETMMPFISEEDTSQNIEHCNETSGFTLCTQETEKEDVAECICFIKVSPELSFLSSPELVMEGNREPSKKESCELNTQEADVIVNSEEEAFVGPSESFLRGQDSNMMEIPATVNFFGASPESNYSAAGELLAEDDDDSKGGETYDVHIVEKKGHKASLDSLATDSYEDSFATSEFLSHSAANKMIEIPGAVKEDLSESQDERASNHHNDVSASSDDGGNNGSMVGDSVPVLLIQEENIMETLKGGQKALSDLLNHSSCHSAGIFLPSSVISNDEAYSSNSSSYILYSSSVEGDAHLAGRGGCSDSKDEMNFAFLDTAIFLNEVSSAESWIDNNGHSKCIADRYESLRDGQHAPPTTSDEANVGLKESFISPDKEISSEIFSLYSRSSSCVSEVNMIETLRGSTFPEIENDERNLMMVPNVNHEENYANDTRSTEFIQEINMMETLNIVDVFEGSQVHEFSEQQCGNDFTFHKTTLFPKGAENVGDYLTNIIGGLHDSKETLIDALQSAQPGLSKWQDEDLHDTGGISRFSQNASLELQPQKPLNFKESIVYSDKLCVTENNSDNGKSSLGSAKVNLLEHLDGDQGGIPQQQDDINLGFKNINMACQGVTSENHFKKLGYQHILDANMTENLQGSERLSSEILIDDIFSNADISIPLDGGNKVDISSNSSGSVMHAAEINTAISLGLQEGLFKPQDEKAMLSISQQEVDCADTDSSNSTHAEATMIGAVQDANKPPSHSLDEHPGTYISSDKSNNATDHSNYSRSSSSMPGDNLIEILAAGQEGHYEPNDEHPSKFEETSISENASNPTSASHISMKESVGSSGKGLPDPLAEYIDRFDTIPVDERANKALNENVLNCDQITIIQDQVNHSGSRDSTEASDINCTEGSESVNEGFFEPEQQTEPESVQVLSKVAMPFSIDEGKETELDHRSSSTEPPIVDGREKGSPEGSKVWERPCTDEEPKDLEISDMKEDVEDLDKDNEVNSTPSDIALGFYLLY